MPMRQTVRKSALRRIGNILLVLTLLLFVWLTGGAAAYGWMLHADHYGQAFAFYGAYYYLCACYMTAAVIFYFCRRNRIAALLGLLGWLPVPVLLLITVQKAALYGWSGQTAQSFGRTAAAVWRGAMLGTAIPAALLLLLALTAHAHPAKDDNTGDSSAES
ncbi:MAG: hypothetical protein K5705_02210 [Oscillospiraceae bacterium]|nr:hypothetical protein [Oscillospiraceae bacterium]